MINSSKTIIWNGPMGVFEMVKFESGTKSMMDTVVRFERERETERERQTDRQTETDRQRDRKKERQGERDTHRE